MDELSAWKERALQAESRLREIACIPNDSIGWNDVRSTGGGEALETLPIPEKELIYLRQSVDQTFPAELCVRDSEGVYSVYGMTPRALMGMLRTGVALIAQTKFFNPDPEAS